MERCSTAGITCGMVKEVAELLSEPHLRARGTLQDIRHPMAGTVPNPSPAPGVSTVNNRLSMPQAQPSASIMSWCTDSCWAYRKER